MMVLLRSFIPSLGALLLAAGHADAQGLLIDKSEIRFVSKQWIYRGSALSVPGLTATDIPPR